MTSVPEIYADGVGTIRLAGGMIRVDLVSLIEGEPDDQGRPPSDTHHRLVMTPQAFLQSLNMMQQLVGKLVDAGVLRREPTPGTPITANPPASPNF
jgi:hypothetical protein